MAIKGFEGGQMPIIKRLPKRGFNSLSPKKYKAVNIYDIEALLLVGRLNEAEIITKEKLVEIGLIKNSNLLVKLLSVSTEGFAAPLSFKLDAYSSKTKELIEKVGGQIL